MGRTNNGLIVNVGIFEKNSASSYLQKIINHKLLTVCRGSKPAFYSVKRSNTMLKMNVQKYRIITP